MPQRRRLQPRGTKKCVAGDNRAICVQEAGTPRSGKTENLGVPDGTGRLAGTDLCEFSSTRRK
jgi:hypothetical protein